MRVSLYKTTAFVLLLSTFHVFSQKKDKNFKEEFKVKSDVVIDINTRHSDIQIETWNKDKVTVEAYMMVEGEEENKRKSFSPQEISGMPRKN